MKAKKLSLLVVVIILATMTISLLAGCTVVIEDGDIYKIMNDAIVNSTTQKTYYVKNIKTGVKEKGDTLDMRINIWGDSEKTEVDDTKGSFTVKYLLNTVATPVIQEWVYGAMLPKSVKKPSKASVSDYKNYMLSYDSTVKEKSYRQEATMETFLALPQLQIFRMENLMSIISDITEAEMMEKSASKYGVVTTIKFVLNKAGHLYDGKHFKINVMYNKISDILISKDNKETAESKIEEFQITYQGPNITLPRYDDKYYDNVLEDKIVA